MALPFYRRMTLVPGVRLNLSKREGNLSFGPRGASVTVGPRGTYGNLGLPGTGLWMRQKLSGGVGPAGSLQGGVGDLSVKFAIQEDGSVKVVGPGG